MTKVRITLKALTLMVFMLAFSALANAQATRTWVSGVGDDVNPCSRTAPCKTFAGAISKTFINGEINCLDPGGYGTLTITKSITVDCEDTQGSVLASGAPAGFTINIATNVNDPLRSVTLRGLSINGAGASGAVGTRTGTNGIRVTSNGASTVFIEECVVFHFSNNGFDATNALSTVQVSIKNSVFRDNGQNGLAASSNNGSFFVRVAAHDSFFSGNAVNGINGGANSRITADNCSISANGTDGALSRSLTAGLNSVVTISNSELANNGTRGLEAGGGGALATSFLVIDGNNVSGSGTSAVLVGANGEIDTYGNNHFFGNNNNACTGCTAIAPANQ